MFDTTAVSMVAPTPACPPAKARPPPARYMSVSSTAAILTLPPEVRLAKTSFVPSATVTSTSDSVTNTGITPAAALPGEAPAAMPRITAVSLPPASMIMFSAAMTVILPAVTSSSLEKMSAMRVAPTATVLPPTATAAAASAARFSLMALMMTDPAEDTILAPSAISMFVAESDTTTPMVPAADASAEGSAAAEAAASTLISLSSVSAVIRISPSPLSMTAEPISFMTSALSTVTATVPPAATWVRPPATDRDTRMSSTLRDEMTFRSSSLLMTAPSPTFAVTELSIIATLTAPPTVAVEAWVPVARDAATVTSMRSSFPLLIWV